MALWCATAVGDGEPGSSMAPAVHRIALYDQDRRPIRPGKGPMAPLSLEVTCNKCHDVLAISSGWHFNAGSAYVDPGRAGEPWILADARSGTQLPISARAWKGSYQPAQAGLTRWQFVQLFGRNMTGGGLCEAPPDREPPDAAARWRESGSLEINCLLCHSGEATQDHVQWARSVAQQNFRWAALASSGLGSVTGSVKSMEQASQPASAATADHGDWAEPRSLYDLARFDARDKVFLDIRKTPSADRCYACHTTSTPETPAQPDWQVDRDVHMAAGMTCVDCHRNGLDHAMTRGYEGEAAQGRPAAPELTCRGCHLGGQSAATTGGRMGAPVPRHAGLPAIHLTKLSCTACHSGQAPAKTLAQIHTSRAHALGLPDADGDLPRIVEPVFALDRGVIAPHRAVWPAFWGRMSGPNGAQASILPDPAVTAEIAQQVLQARDGDITTTPAALDGPQIIERLKAMAVQKTLGKPVYVCGGKVWELGNDGKLASFDHPAANPCIWPIAHDVRPKTQALGARGCGDCHAKDSPVLFGSVQAQGPVSLGQPEARPMYELAGLDGTYQQAFATTFVFRPYLKVTLFVSAAIIVFVLLAYGLAGLRSALRRAGGEQ